MTSLSPNVIAPLSALSVAHLQAVSTRRAVLTDQPELQHSREAFEVRSDLHHSCRELPQRGLLLAVGVGCVNANATNMKNGLFFHKKQHRVALKIAMNKKSYFCSF